MVILMILIKKLEYKNKYFFAEKMDFSEPLLSIQNGIQAGWSFIILPPSVISLHLKAVFHFTR
jgi:hypothetical protein